MKENKIKIFFRKKKAEQEGKKKTGCVNCEIMSLSNLRTNEIPRTVEGEWLMLKNSVTKKWPSASEATKHNNTL